MISEFWVTERSTETFFIIRCVYDDEVDIIYHAGCVYDDLVVEDTEDLPNVVEKILSEDGFFVHRIYRH